MSSYNARQYERYSDEDSRSEPSTESWADKLSKSGIDVMSLYRLPIFKMGVMPLSSVGTLAAMASLMSLTSDSPSVLRDMPWSVAHGQLAGADVSMFSGLEGVLREISSGMSKATEWAAADCPDSDYCASCADVAPGINLAAVSGVIMMGLSLLADAGRTSDGDSAESKRNSITTGLVAVACFLYSLLTFSRDCYANGLDSVNGMPVAFEESLGRGWYLMLFACLTKAVVVLTHVLTPVLREWGQGQLADDMMAHVHASSASANKYLAPAAVGQSTFAGARAVTSEFVGSGYSDYAAPAASARVGRGNGIFMGGKERALRTRIDSVSNTRKITEAMRLVAAAKVRRAQSAVIAARPFSETLQSVFNGLIEKIGNEDVDLPILESREVKKVTLVLITGDRGLCGSYNSYAIKKAEQRIAELKGLGVEVELVTIGKKGSGYFGRRDTPVVKVLDCGQAPTSEEATEVADYLMSSFLGGETDSVEVIYTNFQSLIASTPAIRTLLPLSPSGIESEGDELCLLTTKDGKIDCEVEERGPMDAADFPRDLIFEQDPVQILNAILPLYLNGQVLRMLQESVASELAARMQAMQSASDNAKNLKTDLSREYNRARQAGVTQEILEIVAGATAAQE